MAHVAKEVREPLFHSPVQSFTLKRGEHKQAETARLLQHLTAWLSRVTGVAVAPETVCEDLVNGVCLCKLLTMIEGSGVTKYHELSASAPGAPLDTFKSKENMAQFQAACNRLKLPVVFGTAELEQKNLFQVASALLFLVHTASEQGVGVQELKDDAELTERVRAVTEATAGADKPTPAPAPSPEGLSWWQQLLVRFGFGDWIDALEPEKLQEYRKLLEERVAKIKADALETQQSLSSRVLQQTASFKESLPESLKSRISA